MARLLILLAVVLAIGIAEARVRSFVFRRGVDVQACLDAHNSFRSQHGAEPLKWDDYLAKHAQAWADTLAAKGGLSHSPQMEVSDREGENLAHAGSCPEAVAQWIGELAKYKKSGACTNPPVHAPEGTDQVTQLMWQTTTSVGVGIAGNVVVARYFPPGNFEAEYEFDVKC
ncbi:ectin [Nematostella vectensis]|uniref:ectin n=1 Tax=Nematostella vectensis TaxID=45351 RepID=UPI0020778A7D|nr:ectin [Nematostella vectensis]